MDQAAKDFLLKDLRRNLLCKAKIRGKIKVEGSKAFVIQNSAPINKYVLESEDVIVGKLRYKVKTEEILGKGHTLKFESNHLSSTVKEKISKCDQCPYSSTKSTNMIRHAKNIHNPLLKCINCSKSFGYHYHYQNHMKLCKQPSAAPNACDKSVRLKEMANNMPKISKRFLCNICTYQSDKKCNISCHMKTVHEPVEK